MGGYLASKFFAQLEEKEKGTVLFGGSLWVRPHLSWVLLHQKATVGVSLAYLEVTSFGTQVKLRTWGKCVLYVAISPPCFDPFGGWQQMEIREGGEKDPFFLLSSLRRGNIGIRDEGRDGKREVEIKIPFPLKRPYMHM